MVVAAAALRGAVVAIAGVLLTAGLALMVWAVTPASGPDAAVALRGGVTAFALANLMPVAIGGVTLSLPPLLLTAVPAGLLFLTARRGRFLPVGRYQEAVAVATTAGVYGLVVAAVTRGYSSPDAVPAGWVWTAFTLALVATAAGMMHGDSAWSRWALNATAGWARAGLRGALVGTAGLIGAGALVLAAGLIGHFGTAVDIAAATAPSWLDGLGVTLLGLAYLPNAVVAAVGFVSGVGFEIGPGTYSPLATSTVDLPGVPLLAAAPQHDGRSVLGLVGLVVPLLVGYLVARPAIRRLVTRVDRVAAAALGSALTGAAMALAATIARGGVGDGRWSGIGVSPLLLGPLIAVEVGAVSVIVAAVTGWRTVPWRIRDIAAEPVQRVRRPRRTPAATEDGDPAGQTGPAEKAEQAGEPAEDEVQDHATETAKAAPTNEVDDSDEEPDDGPDDEPDDEPDPDESSDGPRD